MTGRLKDGVRSAETPRPSVPSHIGGCRTSFPECKPVKSTAIPGQLTAVTGKTVKWLIPLQECGLGRAICSLTVPCRAFPSQELCPAPSTPCYSIYEVLFCQCMEEITPCLFKIKHILTFIAIIIKIRVSRLLSAPPS